jgi:hypothetical protein
MNIGILIEELNKPIAAGKAASNSVGNAGHELVVVA